MRERHPGADAMSQELRALVEKWRYDADRHKTHGDSYRIGQGWALDECADELAAALDASGWQPIESAPKDGTQLQGVIDGRCGCTKCVERTENIYRQVSSKCLNCGAGPFLILYREGDKASAQDCPRCRAGYKPVSALRPATDDEIPSAVPSPPDSASGGGRT